MDSNKKSISRQDALNYLERVADNALERAGRKIWHHLPGTHSPALEKADVDVLQASLSEALAKLRAQAVDSNAGCCEAEAEFQRTLRAERQANNKALVVAALQGDEQAIRWLAERFGPNPEDWSNPEFGAY